MKRDQPHAEIMHDTRVILDVNDAACVLFACEREALFGFDIFDLVWSADFQGLGHLRMRVLREAGKVPPVEYLFHRFDGSRFYGRVQTERIEDGRYRSVIEWQYDLRGVDGIG